MEKNRTLVLGSVAVDRTPSDMFLVLRELSVNDQTLARVSPIVASRQVRSSCAGARENQTLALVSPVAD